ncbi:MAG: LysM peptidoglycan-binding domain-containing protein [Bacteroidales bacterium]|nr:LysM peptidoglycan-binding domain-containing protein [Bacteroidales bacterium]
MMELAGLAMPSETDFVNNIPVPNTDSNAMQNYTQEFSYDELGNIEQIACPAQAEKSVGDWTRDYYYETTNNRLLNHDNQTDVYDYDEHGNCVEMPHLPELIWDYKDELKEVDLGGGGTAYYVYDSSGERVRKVVDKGSVVEERLYIGGFEVYRKTVSGTLNYERETLKISEGRNTIAQLETKTIENGNTISTPTTNQRFQYSNHLGSACLELDSSANIISYEEYHPFGTTSYRSGSSETEVSLKRYKYVGKERDEETGLYYYGARYYAAWIARFVSVDPLQFEYPQLTPYNYAGNKPITFIDIDGLQAEGDEQLSYTVQQGDSPEKISNQFGISIWDIAAQNQGKQEGGGFFECIGNGDYNDYWEVGRGTKWQIQPGDLLVVGTRPIEDKAGVDKNIKNQQAIDKSLNELGFSQEQFQQIMSEIANMIPGLIQDAMDHIDPKNGDISLSFKLIEKGAKFKGVSIGSSVNASISTSGSIKLYNSTGGSYSFAGLTLFSAKSNTGILYKEGELIPFTSENLYALGWDASRFKPLNLESDSEYNLNIGIKYSVGKATISASMEINNIADVRTEFGETGYAAGYARSNGITRTYIAESFVKPLYNKQVEKSINWSR